MAMHRKYSRRMNRQNRSLIKFVEVLFALFGLIGIPKHFSKYSKREFTTWQLFALLVLCTKSKQSAEDFVDQFLPSADRLVQTLGLSRIPSPSTLRKFARRLKTKWAHKALGGCAVLAGLKNVCAGIDGTGQSKMRGSKHYYRRIGKKIRKKDFVKVVGIDDLTTQLILAVKIRKKVRHDNVDFKPTTNRVARITSIDTIIGDKAFDAQKNHDIAHSHGALLITPLKKRRCTCLAHQRTRQEKSQKTLPKEEVSPTK